MGRLTGRVIPSVTVDKRLISRLNEAFACNRTALQRLEPRSGNPPGDQSSSAVGVAVSGPLSVKPASPATAARWGLNTQAASRTMGIIVTATTE